MIFRRIILKLSGELLAGNDEFGVEGNSLSFYAKEIRSARDKGIQLGIVIGGGNIFRGGKLVEKKVIDQVHGDYMGMLATVINGIALQTTLESLGMKTKLITAFEVGKTGELYHQEKVISYFEDDYTLIFTGGTGNPLFTTDSAAALRAVEIKADVILKGTKVDGVYSADPKKDLTASRFSSISFRDVYEKKLKVMDLTAFTICEEHKMPIIVFDITKAGNLAKVMDDQTIGTLIS